GKLGNRLGHAPALRLAHNDIKEPSMLIRFDPFRESDRIAQQLAQSGDRTVTMPMDATRRGDRFFANFDLPGVDTESIDLTVENNVLTVRAERTWQPESDDQVIIAERPQG